MITELHIYYTATPLSANTAEQILLLARALRTPRSLARQPCYANSLKASLQACGLCPPGTVETSVLILLGLVLYYGLISPPLLVYQYSHHHKTWDLSDPARALMRSPCWPIRLASISYRLLPTQMPLAVFMAFEASKQTKERRKDHDDPASCTDGKRHKPCATAQQRRRRSGFHHSVEG